MKNHKKNKLKRKDEILIVIRNSGGIKIKDLSKKLEMWDSNLRKKINKLVAEGKVERYLKDDYLHVRIKK